MAAHAAQFHQTICNKALKPEHPAAQMSQPSNALTLQNALCPSAVCVHVDPCTAACQPTEYLRMEDGIRCSTPPCVHFSFCRAKAHDFLCPRGTEQHAASIEHHTAADRSPGLLVARPIAVCEDLKHVVSLMDIWVLVVDTSCFATPFQGD